MTAQPLPEDRQFLALLATTLAEEHDYEADVEGTMPAGLRGLLFRNGPGRFDRGGARKRHLLDGDGMVQRFAFADGRVRYRNRFVRTIKYAEEEAAGIARFPTWSTRAPGGMLANMGTARIRSQAGITVFPVAGRLLAWDEIGLPWALEPDTLATLGEAEVAGPVASSVRGGQMALKAHARFDASSGHWTLLGIGYGRTMTAHVIVLDRGGRLLAHHAHQLPRQVYLHDFLATDSHVVLLLHPAVLAPLPFVLGLASFSDCLSWRPADGMLVAVIDKAGGEPLLLEAPAAFSWHGLNAYRDGGAVVADWIGFDAPDHFIGEDAALAAVMDGRLGQAAAHGTARRTVIDLGGRRLRHEVVADGNFEFPSVHPRRSCHRHRYGHVTSAAAGDIFADGIARIDTDTGEVRAFHFGRGVHVGEPVVAPGGNESGWLLAQCLDGASRRTFLAIFNSDGVEDGPVARVWLRHSVPASFHGCWMPMP